MITVSPATVKIFRLSRSQICAANTAGRKKQQHKSWKKKNADKKNPQKATHASGTLHTTLHYSNTFGDRGDAPSASTEFCSEGMAYPRQAIILLLYQPRLCRVQVTAARPSADDATARSHKKKEHPKREQPSREIATKALEEHRNADWEQETPAIIQDSYIDLPLSSSRTSRNTKF